MNKYQIGSDVTEADRRIHMLNYNLIGKSKIMKIAFYIHQFPSVSETFIINQVIGLIDRGHDITVFVNQKSEDPIEHEIMEDYNLQKRTEEINYPSSAMEAFESIIKSAPRLSKHLSSLREFSSIPRKGRLAPAYISSLSKYFEYGDPFDIHHAHFGTIGRQWEFLGRHSEAPFLTTFYGFDVSRYVHPNKYNIYEDFWDAPNICLGITHHIRSKMMLLGCPEYKAIKHPIGIDTNRFDAETKRKSSDEPLKVVSVARLTEKKGINYALAAISRCVEDDVDIQYRIAGDGELRSSLEQQVKQYSIEDVVTFHGWANQEEVIKLLSWGDIFLLPSVTARDGDMEGQALVLQEAQAKGLPVVSTYHNGIPEGVKESQTAKLVPERDIRALKRAIIDFISDEELRLYSNKAQKFVRQRFDNQDILDRQERIYESLVNNDGEHAENLKSTANMY